MEDEAIACAPRAARGSTRRSRAQPCLLSLLLAAPLCLAPAQGAAPAGAAPRAPLPDFTLPSIATSDYWLHLDTGLAVTRDTLENRWSSLVRLPDERPDYSLANAEPGAAGWNRFAHSPALVEFAPTHMLASDPQRDYRPQFALANSSSSLNALLRGAGIDASGCLAPLMRMRSTISGTGPRTNVSVSARCNIH